MEGQERKLGARLSAALSKHQLQCALLNPLSSDSLTHAELPGPLVTSGHRSTPLVSFGRMHTWSVRQNQDRTDKAGAFLNLSPNHHRSCMLHQLSPYSTLLSRLLISITIPVRPASMSTAPATSANDAVLLVSPPHEDVSSQSSSPPAPPSKFSVFADGITKVCDGEPRALV